MTELLRIESLCKTYPLGGPPWSRRTLAAVDNVSLVINRGQTLGLVGESGSGKSTLGRCVLGLTKPDSGQIIFDGRDILSLSPRDFKAFRRRVQPVFQDPYASLDPRWPVGRSVREALDSFGIGASANRDARVRDLFDRVGLDPALATRVPAQLSGGQRQRVAIAAALASEPDLIIADEPVSALDMSIQAQILNLFMDLQSDLSVSMLFVTHDLAVVEHVSDQIAVMHLGHLVEVGETDQIINAPRHDYTRTLLAAVPSLSPPQPKENDMTTAKINGIDINYRIDGADNSGETIVLINGLADDLESWGFQVPSLVEAGFKVLSFDNRGIGKSDRPAGPYSAKMMADDAKALVDLLGLKNFHLMGVSMGGMIAQEYALAYPGDLKSATFACTYGKADPFCQSMFAMWADIAAKIDVPFVMRDVALWAFTGPFFEERPGDAAEFAAAMAQLDMSLEAYLAQLAVIQDHDTMDRIGALKMPVMVLAGEEDILIPVRLSERLHRAIPGSHWATVPGGHACLWESPDPFNKTFIDYVRKQA